MLNSSKVNTYLNLNNSKISLKIYKFSTYYSKHFINKDYTNGIYLDYVVAGGDYGRLYYWDRNAIDQWNPHSKKMATTPKLNAPSKVQNKCLVKQVMVNPGTVFIFGNNT